MRLTVRFVLPLILVLAGVAYAVIPLVDRLTLRWFERDLDSRASLIANAADETIQQMIATSDTTKLLQLFARGIREIRGGQTVLEKPGQRAAPLRAVAGDPPGRLIQDRIG